MRKTIAAGSLAAWVAAAGTMGCAPVETGASVHGEAIVDGTRETGFPAVMLLINRRGGQCTSALISPRLVLTARHCVATGENATGPIAPASAISVYVGTSLSSLTAEYQARAIHTIPGSTGEIGPPNAFDLALVELTTAATQTPIEISLERPNLVGADVTAIGFGQTPDGNRSSAKYRTTAHVTSHEYGLIHVDPSVCQGDSGGPMIGPDGRIYGVASYVQYAPPEPVCGVDPGVYNDLYENRTWIRSIFSRVEGTCFADEGGEICDGADNDCDGEVDEDCEALGGACATDADCGAGQCLATPAGSICTMACDPQQPAEGCTLGFYCGMVGCDGVCIPGALGSATVGTACGADTECASGLCVDPGDGMRRCLPRCELDAGRCLAGETCLAFADACGGCVDGELVGPSDRGLGETCGSDADCRSGACREHSGVFECARACDATNACPAGFMCRDGECARRTDNSVGTTCATDTECASGICARAGDRGWCTNVCSLDSMCPDGFACTPANDVSVCAPGGGLVGEGCAADTDCVSGLCARVGDRGTCTETCDAGDTCRGGFECRRTADGAAAVCLRPASTEGGGCSVSAGSGRVGLASLLPLLAALAFALRRRAR